MSEGLFKATLFTVFIVLTFAVWQIVRSSTLAEAGGVSIDAALSSNKVQDSYKDTGPPALEATSQVGLTPQKGLLITDNTNMSTSRWMAMLSIGSGVACAITATSLSTIRLRKTRSIESWQQYIVY